MAATKDGQDSTLGTDPWRACASGDRNLDAADQAARSALADLGKQLDACCGRLSEVRRLREVVRRLERRVFELESELNDRAERAAQALARLDNLSEELVTWKRNESSPSTSSANG